MLIHPNNATALAEISPVGSLPLTANDDRFNVLLVEDISSDVVLARIALNATKVPYDMARIAKGNEVVPYLVDALKTGLPDLVILDLGLPKMDGFEILDALARAPAGIRTIPLVILTGNTHIDYLPKLYDLPIFGYMTKPIKVEKMQAVFSRIRAYRGELH